MMTEGKKDPTGTQLDEASTNGAEEAKPRPLVSTLIAVAAYLVAVVFGPADSMSLLLNFTAVLLVALPAYLIGLREGRSGRGASSSRRGQ